MSRKKRFDDLMEAVTFAEAGEIQTARTIAASVFPDEGAAQGERILAVSSAAGFSRRMIEHAVGMAERLHFGLIALSSPPALARMLAGLRAGTGTKGPWLPAEVFRATAAERGIPFAHAVGRGDPERAVAEIRRRFRRIAFLLVEPARRPEARLSRVDLPVFYLDER
jgi:hypothetical protein